MSRLGPLASTLAVAAAVSAVIACAPRADRARGEAPAGLSVAQTLGGAEDPRFARALEPRPLVFPADHGPHPRFRTEWWYLTGNLAGPTGRHFGYQATFFRSALTPEPAPRGSAWAADQLYMAHFALTDTGGETFHSFERFGRGAQGLAGARAEPLRVWLEDWELAADGGDATAGLPPLTLRLATPAVALDLRLETTKPVVLHGDRGLSRKGPSAGNASYYYSYTRLASSGVVRLGATEIAVEGASWMDREWSTSVLEPGTVGWDWLSLQLDDGTELMFFHLRGEGGAVTADSGTVVAADGSSRALTPGEAVLEPRGRWTSAATGAVYPSGWRLALPADGLDLEIEPRLAGQELVHTFSYWEGAVSVRGRREGRPIEGVGYVELTGYGAGSGAAGAARGGTQG